MDERIKTAFLKVKEDISSLNKEIISLKNELYEIRAFLDYIKRTLNRPPHYPNQNTPHYSYNPTIQHIFPTHVDNPTDNPTDNLPFKALKSQNIDISTGNEGVPTDRQTNRQTNRQIVKEENIEDNLKKAQDILDSLDHLKKEIRKKFKKLTNQEMVVFSSIYQLSEQDPQNTTYKEIAKKLGLTESSIRDYVLKITNKGIPIKKEKIANKKIILSISEDIKNIATLPTIMQLREL